MKRVEIEAALAARLEDCRWMAETGECLSGAARRLGMRPDALEKWLYKHDKEVVAVFLEREPRDHNRAAVKGINVYELIGGGRTSADRRRRRKAEQQQRRRQAQKGSAA